MDVSVSVSFFQDELASTIEHAVKAAVDTVLCEITKVVGGKFTEFQMEMAGKEKENESLKLRLEISESELKAVRECMNAADAGIKQPLRNTNPDCNEHDFQRNENQRLFKDPKESHAVPKSEAQEGPRIEAVYTQEESFDREWCASLKQVTELTCVKDEEDECVPIKEEFLEQECFPIAEEVPTENNVCTLEENNQLGSSLCDDCPPEYELGFRDELASTIEHAVKAAVDTVLCEITKVVGGKFTEFQMEMAGKEKENESLKLRLEISESELKAVRECMNAADADIKQPLRNMNPDCNEQDFQRNENQRLFKGFNKVILHTTHTPIKLLLDGQIRGVSAQRLGRWIAGLLHCNMDTVKDDKLMIADMLLTDGEPHEPDSMSDQQKLSQVPLCSDGSRYWLDGHFKTGFVAYQLPRDQSGQVAELTALIVILQNTTGPICIVITYSAQYMIILHNGPDGGL
ncbi:UNVERIFIED_CONTAM: hypothetical protein FKN15_012140 [Acipenser sinensis]